MHNFICWTFYADTLHGYIPWYVHNVSDTMHGRTQSGGAPQKNHKNIVFFSNTGLDLLEITKLPSQHSMMTRFYRYLDPLSPLKKGEKTRKKIVGVGHSLAKLSESAHAMHAESWLLYFISVPVVVLLIVFCVSSSRWHVVYYCGIFWSYSFMFLLVTFISLMAMSTFEQQCQLIGLLLNA